MLYGLGLSILSQGLGKVLILIFLENALRLNLTSLIVCGVCLVLILIFLENALRQIKEILTGILTGVLILIFLENALRRRLSSVIANDEAGLNPYFFGKCSTAIEDKVFDLIEKTRLNPYFFGKCSTALNITVLYCSPRVQS